MSASIEAEELEAIILKIKCPKISCGALADMIIMRTAHDGVFDHTDVHCDECATVYNTSMIFMPAFGKTP